VTDSKTHPPRHVVLSGGSRGLGMALTTGLLNAGYYVSTFSRKPSQFTDSLAGRDGFCFSIADMADSTSLARFVSTAVERFGVPYGLVNCAGVAFDGMLATMREEQIDGLLAVNLGGTLKLTRLIIRHMLKNRRPGVIVNISSVTGQRGYSGLAAYAATKAGQDGMSRALARELGKRQIRVNSVAPGYLETEMSHALTEAQKLQIVRRTPLKRLGLPGDVVGPVLFLLSDDSAFITGQVLRVDGGIST
jgi:3-oxoacyl-[acyl-carrier protein] reductase